MSRHQLWYSANQSLLLEGLSGQSSLGDVLIQDVAVESLNVPLLRVELKSDLVLGIVTVGSDHLLPVMGVELILGNGLAGGIVSADLPTQSKVSEDAKMYLACVVTRTITKAKEWRGI